MEIIRPASDEEGFGIRIYGKDLENCLELSTWDCPWFLDIYDDHGNTWNWYDDEEPKNAA